MLTDQKAAYECIYTLFSTPIVPSTVISAQFEPLHQALSDDAEIRQLTLLTLLKAIEVHSSTTLNYLPGFVDQFRKIVDAKPKENAVKQEIERMEESRRGVIRLGLDAQRRYPEGLGQEWTEWWNQVRKEHAQLVKFAETEGFGIDN